MKVRALVAALLLIVSGCLGYLWYQAGLVPVPLLPDTGRWEPAKPEYGEDGAVLEVLMPAGNGVQAFLAAQSDLTLLVKEGDRWVGQLLSGLEGSRHGRRWRLAVRPGWRLQAGGILDAARLQQALATQLAQEGGVSRVLDATTLEVQFKVRKDAIPSLLSQWGVPGTGPFRRQGLELTRFDGFTQGRAGVAGLRVVTDPALLESRAWSEGLTSARWAWAAYPGGIGPEDMASVRFAPYDEVRMKDGTVWFLSRRLRRLRPEVADWTQTRLFGAWRGATDLKFEPGM